MIKNKEGVTLIELLIVLSLSVVIISLVFTILFMGSKSFATQTKVVDNQSNVRYVLNEITRDIRKANLVIVNSNIIDIDNSIEYKLQGNTLLRNGTDITKGIESFIVNLNGNKIAIEIKSIPNQVGDYISLSTIIIIRE